MLHSALLRLWNQFAVAVLANAGLFQHKLFAVGTTNVGRGLRGIGIDLAHYRDQDKAQ